LASILLKEMRYLVYIRYLCPEGHISVIQTRSTYAWWITLHTSSIFGEGDITLESIKEEGRNMCCDAS
jgi:hypothetical protein